MLISLRAEILYLAPMDKIVQIVYSHYWITCKITPYPIRDNTLLGLSLGVAMNIDFSGKWATDHNTFGVIFEATVDGTPVSCHVSTDALQDIDPSNALSSPQDQFQSNQFSFQEIAEALINNGRLSNGKLFITSADFIT